MLALVLMHRGTDKQDASGNKHAGVSPQSDGGTRFVKDDLQSGIMGFCLTGCCEQGCFFSVGCAVRQHINMLTRCLNNTSSDSSYELVFSRMSI